MQRVAMVTVVSWGLVAVAGFAILARYEGTAGPQGSAPDCWPADCPLTFATGRCNLVVAIHPCCPCSRATLDELARLVDRSPDKPFIHVLVFQPDPIPADWTEHVSVDAHEKLPEARVFIDGNGRWARLFGAMVSGHVALFDGQGVLRYCGGVTAGRGREGDSPGAALLFSRLNGRDATVVVTPVFGCPLYSDENDRTEP